MLRLGFVVGQSQIRLFWLPCEITISLVLVAAETWLDVSLANLRRNGGAAKKNYNKSCCIEVS